MACQVEKGADYEIVIDAVAFLLLLLANIAFVGWTGLHRSPKLRDRQWQDEGRQDDSKETDTRTIELVILIGSLRRVNAGQR